MTAATTPQARAAAALGVSPDAGADAARAAFLRRLAADGFLPPEECVVGANLLAGASLPVGPDGTADAAARAREDVGAFAAGYWALAPAARKARWAELTAAAPDEPTRRRLAHLEGGLGIGVSVHPNPLVEEAAAAVRELYVLGPRDRAVRRAAWFAERSGRLEELRDASRRLQADAPRLAALDPDLFRRLTIGAGLELLPAIDSRAAEAERNERAGRAAAEMFARTLNRPRPQTADTGGGWSWGGVFVVVAVIGAILRAVSSSGSQTPRPPEYSIPESRSLRVDKFYQPTEFTEVQVAAFHHYEIDRKGVPPPWYDSWVRAGRPKKLQATPFSPTSARFTAAEVKEFWQYLATPAGRPPPRYDEWVRLGYPSAAVPGGP